MPELSAALPTGLPDCAGFGEVDPGLLANLDLSTGLPLMALGEPEPDGEAPLGDERTPVRQSDTIILCKGGATCHVLHQILIWQVHGSCDWRCAGIMFCRFAVMTKRVCCCPMPLISGITLHASTCWAS